MYRHAIFYVVAVYNLTHLGYYQKGNLDVDFSDAQIVHKFIK